MFQIVKHTSGIPIRKSNISVLVMSEHVYIQRRIVCLYSKKTFFMRFVDAFHHEFMISAPPCKLPTSHSTPVTEK